MQKQQPAANAPQPGKAMSTTQPPKPAADPSKHIVNLDYPVTFAGEFYPTLTVRRLKAKDFRQLDTIEGGGNAAAIAMAALICGVDEAIIDELDAVDYMKVQEAIAAFFPKALVDKLQSRASPLSRT